MVQAMNVRRDGRLIGLVLLTAAACGPDKDIDFTITGGTETPMTDPTMPPTTQTTVPGESTGSTGDVDPTTEGGDTTSPGSNQVDVLFVIDNSGSMGPTQGRLAASIGAFVNVLEGAGLDYRVAVTTTDSGNPRCAMTAPEGGNFVMSSCLDRVAAGEFEYNGEDFASACQDFCAFSDSELSVVPTTTETDDAAAPRPWLERTAGQLNVEGASATQALQCYLPQGVVGCGFESQLESMYLGLAKAQDQNSKNYGFLRYGAQLAVVIVTDEADCSYSPGAKEIFTTNKVFWNSPDDPAPTSALCWRAGVECSAPAPYPGCHAENHDPDGPPGASDAQAVLQPLSKYVDFVKGIEQQKQPGQRVKVSLIAGVPVGYDSLDAEIVYADAEDDSQFLFGIGPGCERSEGSGTQIAVPPVREREFAEAFTLDPATARNLYSICDGEFSAALTHIADEIADGA